MKMSMDLIAAMRERREHISETHHSEYPLIIWNYTDRCVFDNAWDDVTRQARGLITTDDGWVVARPFQKFFSPGQNPEADPINWPDGPMRITEKLDGSLGIMYFWDDQVHMATRGSFDSPQALWATEWIRQYDIAKAEREFPNVRGKTILWEIVYPENRIVVDYGKRSECVMLDAIGQFSGSSYSSIIDILHNRLGIPRATIIAEVPSGASNEWTYERVKNMVSDDAEGYVLHWPMSGLRVKVKGDEYLRRAKLLARCSTTSIWKMLQDGDPQLSEMIERLPEKDSEWAVHTADDLSDKFVDIMNNAHGIMETVQKMPDRKAQAQYITGQWGHISGVAFAVLDGNEERAEAAAWKLLRPEHETPH